MNSHTITDKIIAALLGTTIVGLCFTSEVKAETQYSLLAHTVSKHGASKYNFNEVNPGVALRADFNNDFGVQAGVYKNSFYKTTVYAVGQYTPLQLGPVRLGAFGGLASGYAAHSSVKLGSLAVVAGALAIVDVSAVTVGIRAVPKIDGVITFEIGYKF